MLVDQDDQGGQHTDSKKSVAACLIDSILRSEIYCLCGWDLFHVVSACPSSGHLGCLVAGKMTGASPCHSCETVGAIRALSGLAYGILPNAVKVYGLEDERFLPTAYLGWLEHVNHCLDFLVVMGMDKKLMYPFFLVILLTDGTWLWQVWQGLRKVL